MSLIDKIAGPFFKRKGKIPNLKTATAGLKPATAQAGSLVSDVFQSGDILATLKPVKRKYPSDFSLIDCILAGKGRAALALRHNASDPVDTETATEIRKIRVYIEKNRPEIVKRRRSIGYASAEFKNGILISATEGHKVIVVGNAKGKIILYEAFGPKSDHEGLELFGVLDKA